MSKDFKNKKSKRRQLKQTVNYFKNNFGPDSDIRLEKDDNDMIKIIKEEGLDEEYIENNDVF
jgi:hypothetical protein